MFCQFLVLQYFEQYLTNSKVARFLSYVQSLEKLQVRDYIDKSCDTAVAACAKGQSGEMFGW